MNELHSDVTLPPRGRCSDADFVSFLIVNFIFYVTLLVSGMFFSCFVFLISLFCCFS